MSLKITSNVPLDFIQGTTVSWVESFPSYPSPDWTAKIVIRNAGTKVECVADPDGQDGHKFTMTASSTANLNAGHYEYALAVSKGNERYVVDQGRLVVLPDIAADQPQGVAGKSPVRTRYEFYQDLLTNESFVKTLDPGRIEELEMAMRRMEWELKREADAERARRGLNTTRKLYARFA